MAELTIHDLPAQELNDDAMIEVEGDISGRASIRDLRNSVANGEITSGETLSTTAKTLAGAVNELKTKTDELANKGSDNTEVDQLRADTKQLRTDLDATTKSVDKNTKTIGTDALVTVAQTLTGAINELKSGDKVSDSLIGYLKNSVSSGEKEYIKQKDLATLSVSPGVAFVLGDKIYITEKQDIPLTGGAVGDDWKIYVSVSDGKISYQAQKSDITAPKDSIMLGGFHFGRVRNSKTATDVSEGIVPNSVWTTMHRPTCDPSGMAYVGNHMWADIYEMSGDKEIASKYGADPKVNIQWYDAWNLLRAEGKRMPSYGEWIIFADGSPEGQDGNNTYARSATSNKTAGLTGDVKLAISSLNIVDCVGRVWEWVDELCLDPTAGAWGWQNIGTGYGDAYIPSATALHSLLCGGTWSNGVRCGSRAVAAGRYAWNSDANIGGRGVCDSL